VERRIARSTVSFQQHDISFGWLLSTFADDGQSMPCVMGLLTARSGIVSPGVGTYSTSVNRLAERRRRLRPSQMMNVLYLLSDDMRASIGSYGVPSLHTPNLDRLASSSLLFQHAYCQISVCSPSRQSFMTGLRPDNHKVFNFIDSNPVDTQAIPGHFRDHGYLTLGLGKTFHEQQGSWNADRYFNTTGRAGRPYYQYKANECPIGNEGGGQCISPDEEIYDYHLRTETIEYLQHAAEWSREENGKPFFLMAGFRDPHAPWAAPKRMYDLYDEDSIDLPPTGSKTLGEDTPLIAWSAQLNVCLANGTSFPYSYDKPVSDAVIRNQRRAYYSSVSYVDEHIGAILDTLDAEGLTNFLSRRKAWIYIYTDIYWETSRD